jgi:hypothetical protein
MVSWKNAEIEKESMCIDSPSKKKEPIESDIYRDPWL